MGVNACLFGVPGNSPVDYLATLRFVAERIDPGAYIAFYLYSYNDFVDLKKYVWRGVLSKLSPRILEWADHFDNWRKATYIWSYLRSRGQGQPEPLRLWQYQTRETELIRVRYPHDPVHYAGAPSFSKQQQAALRLFFDGVRNEATRRAWRVAMVIHPDEAEFYANLARGANQFEDLDRRRVDAMKICQQYSFSCGDISRYIYERAITAGRNPYFVDNRHFSEFGTRIVAEEFVSQLSRAQLRTPNIVPRQRRLPQKQA
jgi:hypothetical protein